MKDFRIGRQSGAPLPPFGGNARSQTVMDIWQPKGATLPGRELRRRWPLVWCEKMLLFFAGYQYLQLGVCKPKVNRIMFTMKFWCCTTAVWRNVLPMQRLKPAIDNTLREMADSQHKTSKWTFVFHFLFVHVQLKALTSGRKQKIISHHIPRPWIRPCQIHIVKHNHCVSLVTQRTRVYQLCKHFKIVSSHCVDTAILCFINA